MHQALRRNQPARNPREGVLHYIKKERKNQYSPYKGHTKYIFFLFAKASNGAIMHIRADDVVKPYRGWKF